MENEEQESALDEALRRAGSAAALGRVCGVSRKAVPQWKRVPIQHVDKVHARFPMISKKRLLAPHLEG